MLPLYPFSGTRVFCSIYTLNVGGVSEEYKHGDIKKAGDRIVNVENNFWLIVRFL